MSKISLIFLAIVLVAGARASELTDTVIETEQNVTTTVEQIIKDLKEIIYAAQEKVNAIRQKLSEKAKEFFNKYTQQVKDFGSKVQNRLKELWQKAGQIDVSPCKALANRLADASQQALRNMGGCVSGTVDAGKEYLNKIIQLSRDFPADFKSYAQQAHGCLKGNDDSSAGEALSCLKKLKETISAKAAEYMAIVSKSVSDMSSLVEKTSLSLPEELPQCMVKNGVKVHENESEHIYADAKKCIESLLAIFKKE